MLDKRKLMDLIANSDTMLDQYLRGVAIEIVNDIKEGIDETSSGETQERFDPHRFVVASRPGDPPNTDMGLLVNSIQWAPGAKTLEYIVHDGVEYGIDLELGTSKIAARPFVRPVFEVWRKKLAQDMRDKQVIR